MSLKEREEYLEFVYRTGVYLHGHIQKCRVLTTLRLPCIICQSNPTDASEASPRHMQPNFAAKVEAKVDKLVVVFFHPEGTVSRLANQHCPG